MWCFPMAFPNRQHPSWISQGWGNRSRVHFIPRYVLSFCSKLYPAGLWGIALFAWDFWIPGESVADRGHSTSAQTVLCTVRPTTSLNIWPDVVSLASIDSWIQCLPQKSPVCAGPAVPQSQWERREVAVPWECWSLSRTAWLPSRGALHASVFESIRLAAPLTWRSPGSLPGWSTLIYKLFAGLG